MRKPRKTNKAVLYARFSPRRNGDDCESAEQQLEELRAWCLQNHKEIKGEFTDEQVSGADKWSDRPGMFDADLMCKRGDLFLVTKWDRLFRDTEKALAFRTMLEKKGVEIISIHEPATTGDSPIAKLFRGLAMLFAEYEREIIRARTRAAMLRHQTNGRVMSKEPPYGQQIDPDDKTRFCDNPTEQQHIARIIRFHKTGMSGRAIAKHLNDEGFCRRHDRPWNHQLVGTILHRAGEIG